MRRQSSPTCVSWYLQVSTTFSKSHDASVSCHSLPSFSTGSLNLGHLQLANFFPICTFAVFCLFVGQLCVLVHVPPGLTCNVTHEPSLAHVARCGGFYTLGTLDSFVCRIQCAVCAALVIPPLSSCTHRSCARCVTPCQMAPLWDTPPSTLSKGAAPGHPASIVAPCSAPRLELHPSLT